MYQMVPQHQPELQIEHYLNLLNLAYESTESLKGKRPPIPCLSDCQQLAAKLFFHAATIYHLREGTKCPVPRSGEGAFFFDLASVQVITRSALDTYLTLFEVFFEPTTEDELNFRHACWQLSGFRVREGFVPSGPVSQDQVYKSQQEIEEMRSRIKATKAYQSLTPRQRKQVLKGSKMSRSRADRAKAAGFSDDFYNLVYAYQSGYVHADGLSGAQIMQADTKAQQLQYINGSMCLVMIVLAKMILDYSSKFPEAKDVCNADPDTFHWAEVYSGVASRIDVTRIPFFEAG